MRWPPRFDFYARAANSEQLISLLKAMSHMKFAKDANMTFNWPIGAAINTREEIMEPLCEMFEAWAKQKE